MNQEDGILATRIRRAIGVRSRSGIPDSVDLWPHIRRAALSQVEIGTGERRLLSSGWRISVAVALCLAFIAGSVAIATAASPTLRHFLQATIIGVPPGHAGVVTDVNGYPLESQPLPSFTLFYPNIQPAGLLIHGIGQFHPRYGQDGFGSSYTCPDPPAHCTSLGLVPAVTVFIPHRPGFGLPSLLTPFANDLTDVVWFASHGVPPDQRFFQIVEWDATAFPVGSFTAATIPVLNVGQPESRVVLTKDGTTIAIESNLGAAETKRVTDSLQPFVPTVR